MQALEGKGLAASPLACARGSPSGSPAWWPSAAKLACRQTHWVSAPPCQSSILCISQGGGHDGLPYCVSAANQLSYLRVSQDSLSSACNAESQPVLLGLKHTQCFPEMPQQHTLRKNVIFSFTYTLFSQAGNSRSARRTLHPVLRHSCQPRRRACALAAAIAAALGSKALSMSRGGPRGCVSAANLLS